MPNSMSIPRQIHCLFTTNSNIFISQTPGHPVPMIVPPMHSYGEGLFTILHILGKGVLAIQHFLYKVLFTTWHLWARKLLNVVLGSAPFLFKLTSELWEDLMAFPIETWRLCARRLGRSEVISSRHAG